MTPQLIVDCSGRAMSALLVTADGQLVPCSQEIRQVATRHVSAALLFEPRLVQDPDFIWEDALETLSKAVPRDFFQRARRIGLRRPWDPQASPAALRLARPLAVMSSAAALVDRDMAALLSRVSLALLDALLDPTFRFVADRQLAFAEVEPIVIIPAQTGSRARLVLHKLFRRRGFRRPVLLDRELAAAMACGAADCVVVDASDDHLHLHRVTSESDAEKQRIRTAASTTVPGMGWSHWRSRIAAALQVPPSSSFDRNLTTLLTGSPDSLSSRLTHGALQDVLDERWIDTQHRAVTDLLHGPLSSIGGTGLPMIFAGELFSVDALRRVFGGSTTAGTPVVDQTVHSVAAATLSLHGDASRRCTLTSDGSLRINTFHGQAIEIVPHAHLPAPGEGGRYEITFPFAGDHAADKSFLVHLQWGTDPVPEGNATLCAVPLELNANRGNGLRLSVYLRRSSHGTHLHGSVDAHAGHDAPPVRMQFTQQLEVRR